MLPNTHVVVDQPWSTSAATNQDTGRTPHTAVGHDHGAGCSLFGGELLSWYMPKKKSLQTSQGLKAWPQTTAKTSSLA